jgi:hypothetical protein
MNPFVWRPEHQIAMVLGTILGAVILIVIGFMNAIRICRMAKENRLAWPEL